MWIINVYIYIYTPHTLCIGILNILNGKRDRTKRAILAKNTIKSRFTRVLGPIFWIYLKSSQCSIWFLSASNFRTLNVRAAIFPDHPFSWSSRIYKPETSQKSLSNRFPTAKNLRFHMVPEICDQLEVQLQFFRVGELYFPYFWRWKKKQKTATGSQSPLHGISQEGFVPRTCPKTAGVTCVFFSEHHHRESYK